MGNPGRKLARQAQRATPEGKEQIKQEKTEKQAALPPQNQTMQTQKAVGHQPQTQVRQRRAGNA